MTKRHEALERLRRHADFVERRMLRGIEQAPNMDERMRLKVGRDLYMRTVEAEEMNILAAIERQHQHQHNLANPKPRRRARS